MTSAETPRCIARAANAQAAPGQNRHRAPQRIVPSARRGDDAARSVWRATLTSNFTFLSATVGFKCFRDAPADPGPPCRLFGAGLVPPPRCPVNNGALRRTLVSHRRWSPSRGGPSASLSLTKRARRFAEPVHAAYAIEA